MQVYVYSIGLNVGGREPVSQLTDTLRAVAIFLPPALSIALGRSEYQGAPERFVQVAAVVRDDDARRIAACLARYLRQEAVALLRPQAARWTLAYASGPCAPGGLREEYPVITEVPSEE